MQSRRRAFALFALLALMMASAARGAVVYAPPEDSDEAAAEFRGIDAELGGRNYAGVAHRVEAILNRKVAPLVNLSPDDGTLTSVASWIDQLPSEHRARLSAEFAKAFGKAAHQALEAARRDGAATPEQLYAVARRHPLTPAAGAALADAGDRALQLGDVVAAHAFYELAARENFKFDDKHVKRFEAVKTLNGGATIPAPADPTKSPKPQADRPPLLGPLPFDAPWFGDRVVTNQAKLFPVAAGDDRVCFALWDRVLMFRDDGRLLWSAPNPDPPGGFNIDRPTGSRGPVFAPAVLRDVHGQPAVVVARQPAAADHETLNVLRAFAASDGRVLWSTEQTDPRKDLFYAGLPAVSGRHVYAIAVLKTGYSTGTLYLSALDVATGEPAWQTPLGSVVEQGDLKAGGKNDRNLPLVLESFAELSEPAVWGDLVICSPNCGAVIAVGRFDGRVRWVSTYRAADAQPVVRDAPRDVPRALLTRYRSTPVVCRDVVLAMPQDISAVVAIDARSGRSIEGRMDFVAGDALGLAGAAGDVAVLCGPGSIRGVDVGGRTMKILWEHEPPRGRDFTGPAVVAGQTVIAPASAGLVQLDARTGRERSTHAVVNMRKLLTANDVSSALREAGATRAFGEPRSR